MDDEPMWVADRVVAPTPGSAITIPETTNEFAIKGNHMTLIKGNKFDGRTKTDPHKHIHEFLGICAMFKYRDTKNEVVRLMMFPFLSASRRQSLAKNQKTKSSLKKTVIFADEGSSNYDTDKIMARMDAMTMKMDAQYTKFQSRSKQPNLDDDDIPMSCEEEAKFMQTFRRTHFYNDYRDHDSNRDNWLSNRRNDYNRDNYLSHSDDKPDLQKQLNFSCNALADLGASINLMPYSLYAKFSLETLKPTKMSVRLADRSFQYPVGIAKNMLVEVGKFTFPADFVILEMEEDSKVPLILGRPFLHAADAVIRVKQKQLNL
ncbi:reverse transcriptase domain-containing protein [Tanacetum coccineum]